MEFELTTATIDDIQFLLLLRESTMNKYLLEAGLPIDRQAHLERIQYAFDCAYIVKANKQPAGLLKYRKNENAIELIQIHISPEFQNKGLGAKLVEYVSDQAAIENKSVVLSVLKTNPAINLYNRLGFKISSENKEEFLMEKTPALDEN